MKRDSKYYYVRHIPSDLTHHYSVQRICFSLKTKSDSTAVRFSKSITQRLDDYWFGMRLKKCRDRDDMWMSGNEYYC